MHENARGERNAVRRNEERHLYVERVESPLFPDSFGSRKRDRSAKLVDLTPARAVRVRATGDIRSKDLRDLARLAFIHIDCLVYPNSFFLTTSIYLLDLNELAVSL